MTLLPSSSETGAGASEPGSARFPRHMREYLDEHHVNTSLLTALKQLLREQPARAIPRLAEILLAQHPEDEGEGGASHDLEDPASPVASKTILEAAEAAAESADEAHRRKARVRQHEANRSEVIEDEPAGANKSPPPDRPPSARPPKADRGATLASPRRVSKQASKGPEESVAAAVLSPAAAAACAGSHDTSSSSPSQEVATGLGVAEKAQRFVHELMDQSFVPQREIATEEEMDAFLAERKVDLTKLKAGPRSTAQLLREYHEGICALRENADGTVTRLQKVVEVSLLHYPGYDEHGVEHVLIEAHRIEQDGHVRPLGHSRRGMELRSKILPQENWRSAARRAVVKAVIGLQDSDLKFDEESMVQTMTPEESASYPGLQTEYIEVKVKAMLEDADKLGKEKLNKMGLDENGSGLHEFMVKNRQTQSAAIVDGRVDESEQKMTSSLFVWMPCKSWHWVTQFRNEDELEVWLLARGIDVKRFSGAGETKTLSELLVELHEGRCSLHEVDGTVLRRTRVVEVNVRFKHWTLIETHRLMEDGAIWTFNPAQEPRMKLRHIQGWAQGAVKALMDDIGVRAEQVRVDYRMEEDVRTFESSRSYPGLKTEHHTYEAIAQLAAEQMSTEELNTLGILQVNNDPAAQNDLKTVHDFEVRDFAVFRVQEDGSTVRRCWAWKRSVEHQSKGRRLTRSSTATLSSKKVEHFAVLEDTRPAVQVDEKSRAALDKPPPDATDVRLGASRPSTGGQLSRRPALDVGQQEVKVGQQEVKDALVTGLRKLLSTQLGNATAVVQLKALTAGKTAAMVFITKCLNDHGQIIAVYVVKFDMWEVIEEEAELTAQYCRHLSATERAPEILKPSPMKVGASRGLLAMQLAGTSWLLPEFSELSDVAFLISPMSQLLEEEYRIEAISNDSEISQNEVEPGQLTRILTDELFASSPGQEAQGGGIVARVIAATSGRDDASWAEKLSTKLGKRLAEATKASKGRQRGWSQDEWFKDFGNQSADALKALDEDIPWLTDALKTRLPKWTDGWTPLVAMVHGDLHGANVLVDLHGAAWVIDFATVRAGESIFYDVSRLLISMLFENCQVGSGEELTAACEMTEKVFSSADLRNSLAKTLVSDQEFPRLGVACDTALRVLQALPGLVTTAATGQRLRQEPRDADFQTLVFYLVMLDRLLRILTYEEGASAHQRMWALHAASKLAHQLKQQWDHAPEGLGSITPSLHSMSRPTTAASLGTALQKYKQFCAVHYSRVKDVITGQPLDIVSNTYDVSVREYIHGSIEEHQSHALLATLLDQSETHVVHVRFDGVADAQRFRPRRWGKLQIVSAADATEAEVPGSARKAGLLIGTKVKHEVHGSGTVTAVTDSRPQFFLVGASGMGKTVLLRRLVFRAACYHMQDEKDVVPMYINAGQMRRTLLAQPALLYNQITFEGTLREYIRRHHDGTRYQLLSTALNEGRLLVLLDGYHQLPEQARSKMDQQLLRYHGRLVIASRFEPTAALVGGSNARFRRFRTLELPPLTDSQLEEIAHIRIPADEVDGVIEKIQSVNLQSLCQQPMLLSMVFAMLRSKLADKITFAQVYDCAVRVLLLRREAHSTADQDQKLQDLMRTLAFCSGRSEEITQKAIDEARSDVSNELVAQAAAGRIPGIVCLSATAGDTKLRFTHKSLQHYLIMEELLLKLKDADEHKHRVVDVLKKELPTTQEALADAWWRPVWQLCIEKRPRFAVEMLQALDLKKLSLPKAKQSWPGAAVLFANLLVTEQIDRADELLQTGMPIDQEVEDALVRQQGAERDTWHKILKNEQREQANKKLAAKIVAKVCKKLPGMSSVEDFLGRGAYDLATAEIREAIDEAVSFGGKFRITSKIPEHVSGTSVLLRGKALDHFEKKTDSVNAIEVQKGEEVIIKLMKQRSHLEREVGNRLGWLLQSAVVPLVATSDDAEGGFKKRWAEDATSAIDQLRVNQELKEAMKSSKYAHGIVMKAAQRNLFAILIQERNSLPDAVKITKGLAACLQMLHQHNRVHADVKPLNVVRMPNGLVQLIDLDASVVVGEKLTDKTSTAAGTGYLPPEAAALVQKRHKAFLPGKAAEQRKTASLFSTAKGMSFDIASTASRHLSAQADSTGKKWDGAVRTVRDAEVKVTPYFDVWSLGVIAYRMFTHKPLFDTDDSDNLNSRRSVEMLLSWDVAHLEAALQEAMAVLGRELAEDRNCEKIHHGQVGDKGRLRIAAVDFLSWMLARNPEERPLMEEIKQHALFHADDQRGNVWRMPMICFAAALGRTYRVKQLLKTRVQEVEEDEPTSEVIPSTEALDKWLREQGVDVSAFGKGKAKSLGALFKEFQEGSTRFVTRRFGGGDAKVYRELRVCQVHLHVKGRVLFEMERKHENGDIKIVNEPIRSKLRDNENYQVGGARMLRDTLLLEQNQFVIEKNVHTTVEETTSASYPGMLTTYITVHATVSLNLDEIDAEQRKKLGLPEGDGRSSPTWLGNTARFSMPRDANTNNGYKEEVFEWRQGEPPKRDSWADLAELTSWLEDQGIDVEFYGHGRAAKLETLLEQCEHMECELFAMASGLKWENVGSQKPEQGREISNSKLAIALQEKTQFTASEWSAFHISELQLTAVIKVKGRDGDVSYFRPAAIDEKVEDREARAVEDHTKAAWDEEMAEDKEGKKLKVMRTVVDVELSVKVSGFVLVEKKIVAGNDVTVLGRNEKGRLLRIRALSGETWQETAHRALKYVGMTSTMIELSNARRKEVKVGVLPEFPGMQSKVTTIVGEVVVCCEKMDEREKAQFGLKDWQADPPEEWQPSGFRTHSDTAQGQRLHHWSWVREASWREFMNLERNMQRHPIGKGPLHLAAAEGHVEVVKMLMDSGKIDVDEKDDTGSTALHEVLLRLEHAEDKSHQFNRLLECCRLLSNHADPLIDDNEGRSAAAIAKASVSKQVRDMIEEVAAQHAVINKLEGLKPFAVEAFEYCWHLGAEDFTKAKREAQDRLWAALTKTCKNLMASPVTKADKEYMKTHIYPLPLWKNAKWFNLLQSIAVEQGDLIVTKMIKARDEMVQKGGGKRCEKLTSFGEVKQPMPSEVEALGKLFEREGKPSTDDEGKLFKDKLDEVVLVPLLRLQAEQAQAEFREKLKQALPESAVCEGQPTDEDREGSKRLVILAPLKGEPRMAVKVKEYREEAQKDQSVLWPHIQKLGDCLRCTIECQSGEEVWQTWEQVEKHFDVKTGSGRLKNNVTVTQQERRPPDMLVNAVLKTSFDYAIVVEIQIYLRSIHILKQELHLAYNIERATSIDDLLPKAK